jgi:hypothetical protein
MPLRRVGPHEEIHPVFAKGDVKRVRLRIVAFGPLFLGPLSELYGRSHVLQISNLWYLSMCFACLPDRVVNGTLLRSSLEYGEWVCAQQE